MPRFTISPAADQDLDDHAAYLAQEASLETALRFLDAAARTFHTIASMPGLGERRETADPRLDGLRVCRVEGFERHLVFYRPTDDGVQVVRVLHGARDIDQVFG
jgi:toxin ParE1/3/4